MRTSWYLQDWALYRFLWTILFHCKDIFLRVNRHSNSSSFSCNYESKCWINSGCWSKLSSQPLIFHIGNEQIRILFWDGSSMYWCIWEVFPFIFWGVRHLLDLHLRVWLQAILILFILKVSQVLRNSWVYFYNGEPKRLRILVQRKRKI